MKKFNITFISVYLGLLPSVVFSLPEYQTATINNGQVSFEQNNQTLNVFQQSDLLSVNYNNFNIGANEVVNFIQPNTDSIALNRIVGNNASQIFGQLNSNGQVFLVNPNGILFGNSALIDVGGLFATTLNISDENFYNRYFSFDNEGKSGLIENYGEIKGNYIALVAPRIDNFGQLSADMGAINLHAADAVDVLFNDGINIQTTASSYEAVINNYGTIAANGGQVVISASARNELIETVINNEGVIKANGIKQSEGRIFLVADNKGDVINAGLIDASAKEQDVDGGEIKLNAQRIAQLGEIHADALANADGGMVHLKADQVVALGEDSVTTANAGVNGKGGEVIALSPDTTLFRSGAIIEAKGGAISGDGGYVDVSGFKHVEAFGGVNVSSRFGMNGTFLIDPTNITIGSGSTNVTPAPTFEATSTAAFLDLVTLLTALESGAAIVVRTDTGFDASEDGNITINPVVINIDSNNDGPSGSTLTLIANNDIIFSENSSMQDPFTADATLDISLNAGNDIVLNNGVFIETIGGTFTAIAGNDFNMADTSIINTTAGAINITAANNVQLGSLQTTNNTSNAIDISAVNIIDGGDTDIDLIATAGKVNLIASGFIGDTNALETNVNQLDLNLTGFGNARFNESNNIELTSVVNVTDLEVTAATGNITIPDSGLTVSGDLTLIAQDIIDTDRSLILNAQNAVINATAAAGDFNLATDITGLDVTIGAIDRNLTVTEANDIVINNLSGVNNLILNAATGDTTVADAGTNVAGTMSITSQDLLDNGATPRDVNLGAQDLILNITAAAGDVGVNGNFNTLDATMSGTNRNLAVTEADNITISNLSGLNDFSITASTGSVSIPDAGLNVSGALSITSQDVIDVGATPRDLLLTAQDLNINLSNPGGDSNLITNVNTLSASLAGTNRNLSVTEVNDINITALSGVNNFTVDASSGTVTIPDIGISVTGNLDMAAQDIVDSNRDINITATDVVLDITSAAGDTTINSSIDRLDAAFSGGNLTVNESNGLQIESYDVTNATAINVADGDFSVRVQSGDLIINDTVQAQDATADGIRSGMLDLQVDAGDLLIGNNGNTIIQSINTLDQTVSGGLDGNQASIRIHNPDTSDINSNIIIGDGVGSDVQITAQGGDIVIASEAAAALSPGNTRDVTINSDVVIDVYNLATDTLNGTAEIDSEVINNAVINVRSGRSLLVKSDLTNLTPAPPVIAPIVVTNVENEVAAITQEQEQVSSLDEVTPSSGSTESQLLFNQVFNTCGAGSSIDEQKKCGQAKVMMNFLNSLLIGGNLPEMNVNE